MPKWWAMPDKLRQFEDSNTLKVDLKDREARLNDNSYIDYKKSFIAIVKGSIAIIVMTSFEYASKNPNVTRTLKSIFTFGYFISTIAVLWLPYGIYMVFKKLFNKKTNLS